MSLRTARRDPSGLRFRKSSGNLRAVGNRSAVRPVIQGVGKRRGVGAVLLAAGLVLSGCASGDDQAQTTTTTSAAAERSGNPWDLPLEQRPPLFDPCAEIPVEAVEEAVGGPMEPLDSFTNRRPGELLSCGWRGDEVHLTVLSTWKAQDDFLSDPKYQVANDEFPISGRIGIQLTENAQSDERGCHIGIFTPRGSVIIGLGLHTSLHEFRGEYFAQACEVQAEVAPPIISLFPKGDIR